MTEITSNEDIELFMDTVCGFHDSCIVSVNYRSGTYVDRKNAMVGSSAGEHTLSIVFNSQWCAPFRLMFEGVRKFSVIGWQENFFCDIFGAYLGFNNSLLGKTRDDRLIIWADDGGFDPSSYSEDRLIPHPNNGCSYVVADRLFYEYPYEE